MSRATLLTIHWADDLPDSEIVRLSRAWGATISAKPVVESVRIQMPVPVPEAPAPELPERGRGRPRSVERRRLKLVDRGGLKPTGNFVYFRVGSIAQKEHPCFGCWARIAVGEPNGVSDNSGHICMACIEAAEAEPE